MNHVLRIAIAGSALFMLAACESERVDPLKSPCVGAENSPCGPKRIPVDNYVSTDSLKQA